MPWLFLFVSLIGACFTYNAYRPRYAPAPSAVLSFFAGWLTTELALHHIAWQVALTLLFIWAGALRSWPGWIGLGITLLSWVGLLRCYWRGHASEELVARALEEGLGTDYRERILPDISARFAPSIDWKQILMPFPMRHPDVERQRDIVYRRVAGLNLKLDVYRHRGRPERSPTLMQIHGGGWVLGSKNQQGIPLMLHMASRGWTCISVDYRLSPHATFPEQLIDLKEAIRWIRTEGAQHGADPDFLVVTGGSAGGHLGSLVALTSNDPEYQPGFEDTDTSVQGCVAFYGVYDFTNRHGVWHNQGLAELLEKRVMKASIAEQPAAYEKASPMSRVHPAAPPFFVLHGDLDTLVPVEEARRFCSALRSASREPVVYVELAGAQHAFEIFPSVRTAFAVHGVERFLAFIYSRHLRQRQADTSGAAA